METTIEITRNGKLLDVAQLTTNHAASSYGQPVLVLNGVAYGPADVIPGVGQTAEDVVLTSFRRALVLGEDAGKLVRRFTGRELPTIKGI